MLSKSKINQIRLLKKNEHKSDSAIAKIMGVSRGTVTKYLHKDSYIENEQTKQFDTKYKKILEDNNETLLSMIKSVKYSDITKLAMGKLNTDTLDNEISKNGIRSIIALIGNSFDKGMAYERLELDKRKVEIAERTLNLKEQELQARLDNPDAFSNIVIIDDTDKAAEYYKNNGIDKQYATSSN